MICRRGGALGGFTRNLGARSSCPGVKPDDPFEFPVARARWRRNGTACDAAGAAPQPGENQSRQAPSPASAELQVIHAEQDKDVPASLKPYIQQGQQKVERFFSQPFKLAFEVEVLPDRAAFDKYFHKRWKFPKTEAWMVASGVGTRW